uniref:Putative secreted protein n=1 Tax=Ixodes ricinus TaxID=34613 RepID=V5IBX8_IXORI
MRIFMKLGITSSIFIIVAIASARCQMYPEIIANWTRTGLKIIHHGCPTTARTEDLSSLYPDCPFITAKAKHGDWRYGFYYSRDVIAVTATKVLPRFLALMAIAT